MPLITDKKQVQDIYAAAAEKKRVIPCFCSENLTTTEAVLTGVKDFGDRHGEKDLPVTLAITNLYSHRSQSVNYTHTRNWRIGLELFMRDLRTLCEEYSPFKDLNVMVHLDHIQHDADVELLSWNMEQFSSIMYDASSLPPAENIRKTAEFVERNRDKILIEGACDEIVDAAGNQSCELTSPDKAEEYISGTGADMIVVNLGTEHRAGAAELKYHGDMAKRISARIGGASLVLHGCSSVSSDQIRNLFDDGICKVNIWTALERDSSPALLTAMAHKAAKIAGSRTIEKLIEAGIMGGNADHSSRPALDFYTTVYRQKIVFEEMQKIVNSYLELWYM
ncbi:MAG: class II fructose-bisphosphate aldolase [Victivallales bacterium]|nr:class II fructose-bisphosphate aldolase [Victivallales bacterium]